MVVFVLDNSGKPVTCTSIREVMDRVIRGVNAYASNTSIRVIDTDGDTVADISFVTVGAYTYDLSLLSQKVLGVLPVTSLLIREEKILNVVIDGNDKEVLSSTGKRGLEALYLRLKRLGLKEKGYV